MMYDVFVWVSPQVNLWGVSEYQVQVEAETSLTAAAVALGEFGLSYARQVGVLPFGGTTDDVEWFDHLSLL